MFKKQYITGAFLAVISLFSSCTNLDEEIFSSIPEKDFYKTESEFLAAMVPIYSSMRTLTEHSNWWDLEETTDVCVTPVKNHGLWYDGGIYIRLHQHSWMEEDAHLNNIWNALYSGVSSANRVLYQFENSTNFVNPGPNGSNWRSNVLLFSDDQDLSDGLTINGATMDESGKNAREICYGGKDGSGNGDWTSIPTAAIRANGIDYVHYMNIRNWAGWITNFSSLYKSSDNGITWTRCQNVKFGSTSNFGQVSYFKKDGYIYMVGTITGRDNKPHLARFLEENIENQTEYEFWNGSGWIKGNETAATPLFNDISGELSIAYHPEFKKWILLYFNSTRYDISFRTADHIIGEWSKPQKLVDGWQYSQLYGSYIHPISLKGNILYFIMSMWLPYNTYLMSAELKCNP